MLGAISAFWRRLFVPNWQSLGPILEVYEDEDDEIGSGLSVRKEIHFEAFGHPSVSTLQGIASGNRITACELQKAARTVASGYLDKVQAIEPRRTRLFVALRK